MANKSPEQKLIDLFIQTLNNHSESQLQIETLHNSNCKSKTFADIEFLSKEGDTWAIEAKSNDSSDKYNSVHKLFGELLKETGRNNRDSANICLLISNESKSFYSRLFQSIKRNKFIEFGNLIPITHVFTLDSSKISTLTWTELYDYYQV